MTPAEPGDLKLEYPRPLTEHEKEWIGWILPLTRVGYKEFAENIFSMRVIGVGRRGEGEIILGKAGDEPDFELPLSRVFAYGVFETDNGEMSITVREVCNEQISVEIVSTKDDKISENVQLKRKWTYSTWLPGLDCPQCERSVREVNLHSEGQPAAVLAICQHDKRIWVFDSKTDVNKLVPPTNFYNELMLHKNIRDPKIALNSKRLFADLQIYSDADLVHAFSTYNSLMHYVIVNGKMQSQKTLGASLLDQITNIFTRKTKETRTTS